MKNTNLINTNLRTHLQPNHDATSPRRPGAQPRRILARSPKCSALPSRGTVQPPWERIMLIHQAVEARSYPNANTLAADLGISTKTANRDIDYMRQRLHLPLKYRFRPVRLLLRPSAAVRRRARCFRGRPLRPPGRVESHVPIPRHSLGAHTPVRLPKGPPLPGSTRIPPAP